jgi:hypothetical protein
MVSSIGLNTTFLHCSSTVCQHTLATTITLNALLIMPRLYEARSNLLCDIEV